MEFKKAYEIRNNILNFMENNLSKIEGSYNFDIASAVAQELGNQNLESEEFIKELFPWTCTKEPFLSYHLMCYGLTRLGETKAVGEITITGKIATLIPEGTVVISRTGIKYTTDENCVIGNDGTITTKITAVDGGIAGNCAVGEITNFEIITPGITSVTNSKEITGGAPQETVEAAKDRMKTKASVPSHSGNKNNYIGWVKEVGGIGNVSVYGPEDSVGVPAGSVHIYFSTFTGELPNPTQIQQVKDYLNTTNKRPVGTNLEVKSYEELTTNMTFGEVKVKKGSITEEEWKKEFKNKIQLGYATEGFIISNTIPYAKLGIIALEIPGTVLYDDFKINGTTSNLSIAYNQFPVMGEVTITLFREVD